MDLSSKMAAVDTTAGMARAARTVFLLDRRGTPGVMHRLDRSGDAIPLKRDAAVFHRIERPGTTAIPLSGNADETLREARLREAARGFEAIFIRQLLKTMRSTVPGANPYGQGASGEIYGDVIENALAETMSRQENFGIARLLVDRLGAKARITTGQPAGNARADSSSSPLPVP